MTIHDELVLELIRPDRQSKPTGYVIHIVGTGDINYVLEEMFYWRGHYEQIINTFVKMAPDIVVTKVATGKKVAIEIEGDFEWDFAHSLRQVKRYRRNSKD